MVFDRKSYEREYWKAHGKARYIKQKKYVISHKKKIRKINTEWQRTSPTRKAWKTKNIDKIKSYHRTFKKGYSYENKGKIKKQEANRNRQLRLRALYVYGGHPPLCRCCGEPNIKFLTIEHKNGDGKKHRDEKKGSIYFAILKDVDFSRYEVLCYNCNCGKYHNKNICPHEEEK